jgi:hypothetical protein
LPAFGFEGASGAVGEPEPQGAVIGNAADAGDGNAGNPFGNVVLGTRGEQEFVVFSAVEGIAEAVSFGRDYRKDDFVDDSADTAFVADVAEVGGESVADVDHGARELVVAQVLADGEDRDRSGADGPRV